MRAKAREDQPSGAVDRGVPRSGGGGRHEPGTPLFVTARGEPISPHWVSRMFSRAAARAGIQARTGRGSPRVRSHEARDLLKSTLVVAGCAAYAADYVLGHYPRDSYEKQAVLYPETIRMGYAKASAALNLMGGVAGYLGSAAGNRQAGKPEDRQARMEAELRRVSGGLAGVLRVMLTDGGGEADGIRRALGELEGDSPGGG